MATGTKKKATKKKAAKKKATRKSTRQPKRVLNCLPSRGQETDFRPAAAGPATAARLPASVDRRATWWKIGDQIDTGSCVGWAIADGVLRWHFATAGRIPKTARLSVRYAWMASKETDEFLNTPTTFIDAAGTSLKAALKVAKRYGVVNETLLPFDNQKLYRGDESDFFVAAAQTRISGYFNLGTSVAGWKEWLAEEGPIMTRLDVDRTWDRAGDTAGKLDVYQAGTARGGHAVCLVGYRKDGRLIVRNSWGTQWGDKGFAYATEAYASAAFTEAYGVVL